jgi:hypothetical protein
VLRVISPMPLGFHSHPGGILDNSPTFQRWEPQSEDVRVPKGRLRPCDTSAVPSGLGRDRMIPPNVETLGYSRWSLRDKVPVQSATYSPGSIPRGIGLEVSDRVPQSRENSALSQRIFVHVYIASERRR